MSETPTPEPKAETPGGLLGRVERMRDILETHATGGGGLRTDDEEYRALRASLRVHPEIGSMMPHWLTRVRSLNDWWTFIKPKFGSYADRRSFLAEEFEPALRYLEETYPSIVPIRPPVPAQPQLQRRVQEATPVEPNPFDAFFRTLTGQPGAVKPAARPGPVLRLTTEPEKPKAKPRVFVVHGRDHGPRDSVARFLERLKLDPVILEEQPNRGRTIIEKFEAYADVGYAVVVMTPDDMGATKGGGSAKGRARQNVILELGFFIGKLGRDHVAAVVTDTALERPSDVDGVLYIAFDRDGAWRSHLAREMKDAGLPVDLNLL